MDNNLPTKAIVKEIPFEKYNLIMKLHNGTEIIYVDGKKLQKDNFFTGMELLHVADYIVTDYSAIVYEAVITKKPIYFYTFDYNTYMNDRGTYINYKKEMPGAICKSFKNIIKLIENDEYDREKQEEFCKKYIENLDDDATEKLSKFIIKLTNGL